MTIGAPALLALVLRNLGAPHFSSACHALSSFLLFAVSMARGRVLFFDAQPALIGHRVFPEVFLAEIEGDFAVRRLQRVRGVHHVVLHR